MTMAAGMGTALPSALDTLPKYEPRVLTFEYPLPNGGQIKVQAFGVWDSDDCDTIDEFFPLITKAMRRRASTQHSGEGQSDAG